MASHRLWENCGKPKTGDIFAEKNKQKLVHKNAIREAKNNANNTISNQLQESLMSKDCTSFWKTWKAKICKPTNMKPRIENINTDEEAVKKFSAFFEKTCSPNTTEFNVKNNKDFLDHFREYSGNFFSVDKYHVNNEIIGLSIAKLSSGKSAGCDGLTSEHLTNCHPVLFSMLAKLFNLMLLFSHVPPDFGRGITIPIPKNDSKRGTHPISSFRGITLSPVLSKVFEHCILIVFSKYLGTSDNQFAFKKNIGCPQAIFTLNNVVDYFVTNESI